MVAHVKNTQTHIEFVDALRAAFSDWHGWVVPLGLAVILYIISQYNFLLFHTLAEFFAIVVAVILCVVVWHTYSYSRNHFLMYIGAGYFWIAILDLTHALTFKGMNVFPETGPNTSIQLWIVTRYMESILLLSAAYFFTKKVNRINATIFFGIGSLITLYLIFNDIAPDAYIDGKGLTDFKVISEYVIISLLVGAIILLTKFRTMMDRRIYVLMIMSIAFTALAEYSFTLYFDVVSFPLYIGHIFKLFSYWLIFIAVIKTTLTEPYEIMARGSSTYDAIPESTIVVDTNGIIRQVNKAACKETGLKATDILDRDCHNIFHPDDIDKERCIICNHISDGHSINNYEMHFPKKNCWKEISLSPFETLGDIKGMVHVSENITKRKKAEEDLIHQANYDALTQFPNRVLATDRLNMILKRSERAQSKTIIMFIDIDDFKNINDTLGHTFGDKLIIEVASHIESSVRDSDTVARWGGDEFLVILPDMHSLEMAETIANKIISNMAKPISIDGKELNVSVSVGITGAPDDGEDTDTLLKHADTAMYYAKNAGKNTYRFFTFDMNVKAEQHMVMEAQLRNAIKYNELTLHYQPQIDLVTRKVVGCEALLRWDNEMHGVVSPDYFIPLAEESKLIISLGEWVMHQACKDINKWIDSGSVDNKFGISVNISSKQITSGNFTDTLDSIIDKYAVSAERITLEITENLLLDDKPDTIEVLQSLHQSGFKLSLDDFGTGYSSLSYLKKYPFSEIKIDRSFIRDIDIDPSDAALCEAIIAMAESLGLIVVGEGVENDEQLKFLSKKQANIVQGFYFSKPLSEADFVKFISK